MLNRLLPKQQQQQQKQQQNDSQQQPQLTSLNQQQTLANITNTKPASFNMNDKSSGLNNLTGIEQLIYRLCLKIASANNLINDKARDDFINVYYPYIIKLFCSDAYTPLYDMFEVSEKIKKKRKN
jgi:hypothetical protein